MDAQKVKTILRYLGYCIDCLQEIAGALFNLRERIEADRNGHKITNSEAPSAANEGESRG